MEWIEPKTDWKSSDFFNFEDYTRIKNNLIVIQELIAEIKKNVNLQSMNSKTSYSDLIYASDFNKIEQNLNTLNLNSYVFNIGDSKTYYENNRTIDYVELKRIESAMLKLHQTLVAEKTAMNKLSFRLGGMKGIK